MYVRFGDLPEGGRSRNAETGDLEAGVSVFAAYWDSSDRDMISVILHSPGDVIQLQTILAGRPLYLVEGDAIGTGGDGEPVLANATAVPIDGVEAISWTIEP